MEETQDSEPSKTVPAMPPAKASPTPMDRVSPTPVVTQPSALVEETSVQSDNRTSNCKDSTSEITPSTVIIVKEKVTSNSISAPVGNFKPIDIPSMVSDKDTVERKSSSPSREIVNNVSKEPQVLPQINIMGENGTKSDLQNSEPVDLSLTSKTVTESEKKSESKTPSPVPPKVSITTAERREPCLEPDVETSKRLSPRPEIAGKQTNSSEQKTQDSLLVLGNTQQKDQSSRVSPEEVTVEIIPRKISPTPKLIDKGFHPKKISPALGKLENVIERIKPSSIPVNNEQNAELNVSPVRQNEAVNPPKQVSPALGSQEKLLPKPDSIDSRKKSPTPEIHEKVTEPRKTPEHVVTKHTKVKPGLENIVARLGNVPMNPDPTVGKAVRTISHTNSSKESVDKVEGSSVVQKEEVKRDAPTFDIASVLRKGEADKSKKDSSSGPLKEENNKESSSGSENGKKSNQNILSVTENLDGGDISVSAEKVDSIQAEVRLCTNTEKELPVSQKQENAVQELQESRQNLSENSESDLKTPGNVENKEKDKEEKNTERSEKDKTAPQIVGKCQSGETKLGPSIGNTLLVAEAKPEENLSTPRNFCCK